MKDKAPPDGLAVEVFGKPDDADESGDEGMPDEVFEDYAMEAFPSMSAKQMRALYKAIKSCA